MNYSLVTLAQAKTHLYIVSTDTTRDADISDKMIHASAIVLHHHKLDTVPAEWLIGSPQTVEAPPEIQAQTLLVLGSLVENRESEVSNPMPAAVKALRPRRPTLA